MTEATHVQHEPGPMGPDRTRPPAAAPQAEPLPEGMTVAPGTPEVRLRLPMIVEDEVCELSMRYGTPIRRTYHVVADDYIYTYRWRKDLDRRAEVVFVLQEPAGRIWVHAKPHYPARLYRLPSGGVHWHERVEDALFREIEEETGLTVYLERFLGLIEYRFHRGTSTVQFASYIFHLRCEEGVPVCHASEKISEFRPILPAQLSLIIASLRNLMGDRRGWGQWRALAHDLVYRHLVN